MEGIFDDLITYVRVDTTALPTFVIDQPLVPGTPSGGTPITRRLKPRIEIGIRGAAPIVLQKWGDPRPTKWPYIATGLGVGGGLLLAFVGVGVYSIVRKPKRSGAVGGLASLHRQRRSRRRR